MDLDLLCINLSPWNVWKHKDNIPSYIKNREKQGVSICPYQIQLYKTQDPTESFLTPFTAVNIYTYKSRYSFAKCLLITESGMVREEADVIKSKLM